MKFIHLYSVLEMLQISKSQKFSQLPMSKKLCQNSGANITSNISYNALVFASQNLFVSDIQFNKSCFKCAQVFVTNTIFCSNMQTKIRGLYSFATFNICRHHIFTGLIQRDMLLTSFDFDPGVGRGCIPLYLIKILLWGSYNIFWHFILNIFV